jgi:hypothetical protein
MNKIKFNQISEIELLVELAPDVPLEIVNNLYKSLISKGLVEDLRKSTISCRVFYRPQDAINYKADQLIKSLMEMTKDEDNTWHMNKPGAKQALTEQNKKIDAENRAKRAGIKPIQPPIPNQAGPSVLPPNTNRLVDLQYNKIKKDEEDVEKSGYDGYDDNDNARRKARNVGNKLGIGPNENVKQYTTVKPVGSQTDPKLKKPQPVKVYSEEEKTALAVKMGLKKNTAWGQHLPHPNAEVELAKMRQHNQISPEDLLAQQLYNVMSGKAMLGQQPPPQPTDEQMFGQYVVTEEMAKKADDKWGNTFNNWLVEAQRPISERFASEQEELNYWKNLRVDDRDDGSSGY